MKTLVLLFVFFLVIPSQVKSAEDPDQSVEKKTEKKAETKNGKKKDVVIPEKKKETMDVDLRMRVVREAAREYGFQKGFGDAYGKIQKECEARSRELDMTYPFEQVLLRNGTVRPPVIAKADDFTTIANADTLIRTGTAYRILRQAEFVTLPPSWRTYVLLDEDALKPKDVARELLPRSRGEKKAWAEEYEKAYKDGRENAEMYFQEEMARLNQEFGGMIEYHILNRQGKISLPGIEQGHYAVRISEDTLEIDQRTFVITDKPRFQESDKWRSRNTRD